MQYSIKAGVLTGVLMSIGTGVFYFYNPLMIIDNNITVSLLAYFCLAYLLYKHLKKKLNGIINYGDALKVVFPSFGIAMLIYVIFQISLVNLIVPNYFDKHKQQYFEGQKSVLKIEIGIKGNSGDPTIETNVGKGIDNDEKIENKFEIEKKNYTSTVGIIGKIIKVFFGSLILSLIVSIFFRWIK